MHDGKLLQVKRVFANQQDICTFCEALVLLLAGQRKAQHDNLRFDSYHCHPTDNQFLEIMKNFKAQTCVFSNGG